MCKLNYSFTVEVIDKGDAALDYLRVRGVSIFLVLSIHIHEGDRISRTPLNIMQSRTTPPNMSSVLKHRIELTPL